MSIRLQLLETPEKEAADTASASAAREAHRAARPESSHVDFILTQPFYTFISFYAHATFYFALEILRTEITYFHQYNIISLLAIVLEATALGARRQPPTVI